jgi:hypothetical protein
MRRTQPTRYRRLRWCRCPAPAMSGPRPAPPDLRRCHRPDVVATLMQGDTARLCFTSPPYGNQRDYTSGGIADWDG